MAKEAAVITEAKVMKTPQELLKELMEAIKEQESPTGDTVSYTVRDFLQPKRQVLLATGEAKEYEYGSRMSPVEGMHGFSGSMDLTWAAYPFSTGISFLTTYFSGRSSMKIEEKKLRLAMEDAREALSSYLQFENSQTAKPEGDGNETVGYNVEPQECADGESNASVGGEMPSYGELVGRVGDLETYAAQIDSRGRANADRANYVDQQLAVWAIKGGI